MDQQTYNQVYSNYFPITMWSRTELKDNRMTLSQEEFEKMATHLAKQPIVPPKIIPFLPSEFPQKIKDFVSLFQSGRWRPDRSPFDGTIPKDIQVLYGGFTFKTSFANVCINSPPDLELKCDRDIILVPYAKLSPFTEWYQDFFSIPEKGKLDLPRLEQYLLEAIKSISFDKNKVTFHMTNDFSRFYETKEEGTQKADEGRIINSFITTIEGKYTGYDPQYQVSMYGPTSYYISDPQGLYDALWDYHNRGPIDAEIKAATEQLQIPDVLSGLMGEYYH